MKRTPFLAVLTVICTCVSLWAACSSKQNDSAIEEVKRPQKTAAAEPLPDIKQPVKPALKEKSKEVKKQKLSASHILVMHNDSKRKPAEISRTKEEALTRINEALDKIKKGADFADTAKEYSDCPSKTKGGDLGIFPARRMAPAFSEATMALEMGKVSEPIETSFGYHIIKRQPVAEVHARHILIMHAESNRKPGEITRTKAEAKNRIEEVATKLRSEGADFEALAKEYSDCPSKNRGGDLGTFGKGRMAPPFEKAAFGLENNQISEIVETDFGYHIIQRLP
jgi:parvulin-like peptidyl-prolyl isomerase